MDGATMGRAQVRVRPFARLYPLLFPETVATGNVQQPMGSPYRACVAVFLLGQKEEVLWGLRDAL